MLVTSVSQQFSYMLLRSFLSFCHRVDLANIATSVIMSVTGAAPFNGASDQSLSVAYISAFILVFLVNFSFLYWHGGHCI